MYAYCTINMVDRRPDTYDVRVNSIYPNAQILVFSEKKMYIFSTILLYIFYTVQYLKEINICCYFQINCTQMHSICFDQ